MYVDNDIYLREASKITEKILWPTVSRPRFEAGTFGTQRRSFGEEGVLRVERKVPELVWSDWERPRSRHSQCVAPDMKLAHIKYIA